MDRRIQDTIIMTWEFPVTYNEDTKDRIRYLRTKVDYPQQDDDQAGGGIGGGPVTTTDNKLDTVSYTHLTLPTTSPV